jgi:hypothetical protein
MRGILLRAPFEAVEKPLFRMAVRDPRRSVSVAAIRLQSGFTDFEVTSPQVARRKTPRTPTADQRWQARGLHVI